MTYALLAESTTADESGRILVLVLLGLMLVTLIGLMILAIVFDRINKRNLRETQATIMIRRRHLEFAEIEYSLQGKKADVSCLLYFVFRDPSGSLFVLNELPRRLVLRDKLTASFSTAGMRPETTLRLYVCAEAYGLDITAADPKGFYWLSETQIRQWHQIGQPVSLSGDSRTEVIDPGFGIRTTTDD